MKRLLLACMLAMLCQCASAADSSGLIAFNEGQAQLKIVTPRPRTPAPHTVKSNFLSADHRNAGGTTLTPGPRPIHIKPHRRRET